MKRTLAVLLCVTHLSAIAVDRVTVVCLGDSITKGVRGGVTAEQTFEAHLQEWLTEAGVAVDVVNCGIGGERTDMALKRLTRDVIAKNPAIVLVMYGTNDSAIDAGKDGPRLTREAYEANLTQIVRTLRASGAKPVVMTSIPLCTSFLYMTRSPYREQGPNHKLGHYVRTARLVALREHVPLIDNFAAWAELALMGTDLNALTTDGCHPNPAGHVVLARTIYPTLAGLLDADIALPKSADARGVLPAKPKSSLATAKAQAPATPGNLAHGKPYKETHRNRHGYGDGLTDGIKETDAKRAVYATNQGGDYPKTVTIDLGEAIDISRVVLYHSRDGSTKTVSIATSADETLFEEVGKHEFQQRDGAVKTFTFAPRKARFVRVTFEDTWGNVTHGSPHFMFLREVEVFAE